MKNSTDNPFAQAKPADKTAIRLGLTLLIAAIVHGVVIFSMDLSVTQKPESSKSLDVTLVTFGSGQTLEATTEKDTVSASTKDQETTLATDSTAPTDLKQPIEPSEPVEPAPSEDRPAATAPAKTPVENKAETTTEAEPSKPVASVQPAQPAVKPTPKPKPKPTPKPKEKPKPKPQPKQQAKPQPPKAKAVSKPQVPAQPARKTPIMSRDQLSASLAGIQAENAFARPAANQGPRVSRHHTATSKRDISAWYREAWRKKVERIGNLNYPEEARRQGIYGSLRIRVLINRDGSLNQMRVLQSSGHPTLDQAALNIVRLSAPFAPFTGELAAQYEQVEIIRTWRFEHGDRLSSQ